MENYLTKQRPSAIPAACVPVTHEPVVWAPPMPGAPAGPLAAGGRGTRLSNARIAGNGIFIVSTRFTGDVSGVPPRGRPV